MTRPKVTRIRPKFNKSMRQHIPLILGQNGFGTDVIMTFDLALLPDLTVLARDSAIEMTLRGRELRWLKRKCFWDNSVIRDIKRYLSTWQLMADGMDATLQYLFGVFFVSPLQQHIPILSVPTTLSDFLHHLSSIRDYVDIMKGSPAWMRVWSDHALPHNVSVSL